ncbi:MAG: PEP-CTERM sorting domain-containing protein [Planctomycetia bacterium]|nr:PEP-CTERM sorting domain-containing protein [Planctomycetia bacterium]
MTKAKCTCPSALFLSGVFILALVCSPGLLRAGYKDDIDYTKLANELGAAVPTGAGVDVSQVEAEDPEDSGNYAPDASNAQFTSPNKTFTLMSGASGTSNHATTVGRNFYGKTTSISPGILIIDNWLAGDWLFSGFLKTGSSDEPAVETRRIQNSSWIGSSASEDALRRFDYTINRDNYVAVVALNNGSGTSIPALLAHNYNGITVGRSDGNHSRGTTTFDVSGRVKPDIVAPRTATSYATPVVGAAAALLLETVDNNASLANAGNSEAIKAILMAGATKDEFPGWDRTTTRPLDEIYGAGELNIYNSYHILVAGEQEASVVQDVDAIGWVFDATPADTADKLYYFFEVDAGESISDFSVILAWNRIITDGQPGGANWGSPDASLADLDLKLYDATGFTLGSLLDSSLSDVDNVEHIFQELLGSGRYALEISSDTANMDFAIAWVPEPATVLLMTLGLAAVLSAKRGRKA